MKLKIDFLVVISLIFFLIFLSVFTRSSTLDSPTVLDYDPFWHYRHAKEILENNFQVPRWDRLSFFPPGRPRTMSQGWPYTMAIFYKIANLFTSISIMKIAIISPVVMVALTVISAFFLGRFLTNNWGGLVTALFATLAPTFIGVSMAGYTDTDATVVFYFFLSVFSIFLALKKRSIPYYIIAIIVNFIFVYNWGAGWFPLILFGAFLPGLIVFRIIENIIHQRKVKIEIKTIISELKSFIIPLLIIAAGANIIAFFVGTSNVLSSFLGGFAFTGIAGQPLLVNVSVAELQLINILTKSGFLAIANRVGLLPTLMTLFGLPLLVVYKLIKKIKINFTEIFLYTWALVTFYLILRGVRFSLLFSCATAASTGYVIGHFKKHPIVSLIILTSILLIASVLTTSIEYLGITFITLSLSLITIFKHYKVDLIHYSTIFGVVILLTLMFVSDAIQIGYAGGGMELSQNWYDLLDWLKENADKEALVATWWDPGHIITGYTGLRVHADGAHCNPGSCIPYDHNIRIQNMGRIMSTSDEAEAVDILEKYMQLTPEQCEEVKQKFGDIVAEDACERVSEMYFISSNDLIGKFTWMNYFGGYRAPIRSGTDFQKNPGVCCAATPTAEADQIPCGEFADQGKGVWIWCPWIFSFKEMQQDDQGNPIYIYDYSGLTMSIVQKPNYLLPIYNNQYLINHMTFFSDGQMRDIDLSDASINLERIDGLVWIDPGFGNLIYFAPAIKDSIFAKTFFYDGRGLEHFELVYSNPEIRLYRVKFD